MQPRLYPAVILTLLMAIGPFSVFGTSATNGNIEHVVLCWLENPTEDNRNKVIETTRELAAIPGVIDLRVGPALPSNRDIVDDSFDVGISMSFRNRDDMEKYIDHEEHVRRLKDVFLPLCGEIRVHDFSF